MNIFHKVTLESLKKNRSRTVVTIIGIMLSAALICAVTTSVASFLNYALENMIYNNGRWHGAIADTDQKTYDELTAMEEMEEVIYAQQIGYAEIGSKNEFKPYLYILGMSKGFTDTMPVHLIEGEYPDAAGEILLPEHLSLNGGVKYHVGDTLTLDIGSRLLGGYTMGQNTPCYTYNEYGEEVLNEESISVKETCTYTVVGFYERPGFEDYSAPGYTALTAAVPSSDYKYDIYYTMRDPKDVYPFVSAHTEYWGETNDDVLMMQGSFQVDGLYGMLYGLAAIFIGLIMFGSVSLIYNAFAISVSERTKQFGLLASVGATKKQLRRMVFFEALVVGVSGIAAGILLGIAGIGVTLLLIGSKFSALFEFHYPMRVCVSPAAILIACGVALATVLISAWIPSKRATRVNAIEAIRQSTDIKAENKPVRTPKLVYKLFGLPGMLAHKHYKRSKKKYRATVVSLFMSIVLFISASSFTEYLMENAAGGFDTFGYDIRFYASPENIEQMPQDEILALIAAEEQVDAVTYAQVRSMQTFADRAYLSEQAADYLPFGGEYGTYEIPADSAVFHTTVYFVEDNTFRTLLADYALSEAEYMNPDAPLAIAVDESTRYDQKRKKYIKLDLLSGDKAEVTARWLREYEGYSYDGIAEDLYGNLVHRYRNLENPAEYMDLSDDEAHYMFTMKTGKVIEERPYFIGDSTEQILIYPYCVKDSVMTFEGESKDHVFMIQAEEHAACFTSLKKTLDESRLTALNLHDYAADAEEERNIVTIIQVFSYGFIVLISLIAAANVFNTISTNISLRRREFAMLKSVGMTSSGFNRMMNFECLLYGTKALLMGLPVSFGVTYLIYKAVDSGYSMGFHLPWGAVGIAVLSVFAVVFVTMMYSMSKIKKDNPIDALKNENL